MTGLLTKFTIRGAFSGTDVAYFARHFLVPQMVHNGFNIVFLDNSSIHYNPEFLTELKDAGIQYYFLPAYSPHLNPIEEAFAKVKSLLRRWTTQLLSQGYDELLILHYAFDMLTADDCQGYMRHAGYL
jgi:transposase